MNHIMHITSATSIFSFPQVLWAFVSVTEYRSPVFFLIAFNIPLFGRNEIYVTRPGLMDI